MSYKSKDATFRIEFAADPHPEENEPGEIVPEFRVRVSPVGNGWWTLSEVLALRDKLKEALSCRVSDTTRNDPAPGPDGDRWFIVVVRNPDGTLTGLSRRADGPRGPFSGPWGALTGDEAKALAGAWNADPREGGPAEIVELFRYDNDPAWPEDYA